MTSTRRTVLMLAGCQAFSMTGGSIERCHAGDGEVRVCEEVGMKSFAGKIAVITGGGAGIGRELALRLVSTGCDIALCDVFPENMAETKRLCLLQEQHGARISIFVADVSIRRSGACIR
jgi:hypothetical protein